MQGEAVNKSTPAPPCNHPGPVKTTSSFQGEGLSDVTSRQLLYFPIPMTMRQLVFSKLPCRPPLPPSSKKQVRRSWGVRVRHAGRSRALFPSQPARPPPPLAQTFVLALTVSSSPSPGRSSSAAAMIPLRLAAPERLATPTAAAILSGQRPAPLLAAPGPAHRPFGRARRPQLCPRGGWVQARPLFLCFFLSLFPLFLS